MTITIYTAPNCQPCRLTKREFDRAGVSVNETPLADVPVEQINAWKAQGLTSAPIVIAGDLIWSGMRPDMIKRAIEGV